MPLPNNDPSLPSNPAPIFNDTEAVRGDQLRAAMQLIWGNLQYLFDFTGRTTDTLTEGLTNLYFTSARAIGSALTGFVSGADSAIAATDTVLQAFAKTQGQITPLRNLALRYAKLSDTKSAGTAGGTFGSGSWQTRTLNTEDSDASGIVTPSANQFTLQAGTYRIRASAPGFGVELHKAKLRNVTDSVDTLIGTSERSGYGDSTQTFSIIEGEFTIAGTKTFEVQHQCSSSLVTNGFGYPSNFGVSEVYTIVEIWKVGS